MKLILEFDSYEDMMDYCLKRASQAGLKPQPAPPVEPPKATKEEPVKEEPVKEEPVEEEVIQDEGGIDVINAEVDRIKALGKKPLVMKIRKHLDELGLDGINSMDELDYPAFIRFLKEIK